VHERFTIKTSADNPSFKDTKAGIVGTWDRSAVGPAPPMGRRFKYLSDSDGQGILYFLGSRAGNIHERSTAPAAAPAATGFSSPTGYAAKADPWRHPAWVPEGVTLSWSAPGSAAGMTPEALLSNANEYYHVNHRQDIMNQYPQSEGGLPTR
jgi:hypothetical protein